MKTSISPHDKAFAPAPVGLSAGRRRALIACALAAAAPGLAVAQFRSDRSGPLVEVWKSPTCGCCKDWIEHMEAAGFRIEVDDSGNTAARARLGIAQKFGSCHTALVGDYAIEGHVPASEVRRLLEERPKAVGLAVPGMPIGSPGMDGPAYGGRQDPYDVLLVQADGSSAVYRSYR
ncbi:MAG TPA: DUF411 domain-containing protein [Burkholderiaceae bacterium]|nr:DUF411 domain-containing protein [Burkholderiaceae bacterium]